MARSVVWTKESLCVGFKREYSLIKVCTLGNIKRQCDGDFYLLWSNQCYNTFTKTQTSRLGGSQTQTCRLGGSQTQTFLLGCLTNTNMLLGWLTNTNMPLGLLINTDMLLGLPTNINMPLGWLQRNVFHVQNFSCMSDKGNNLLLVNSNFNRKLHS